MAQRREHARLTLEARQALGVAGHFVREHLDCDFAAEARIPRTVDFAHPSRAEQRDDFVGAEPASRAGAA